MTHQFVKHTDCDRSYCLICDGGLAHCEVCNGAEASLPTDCPGQRMSSDQEAAVQAGRLDFTNGEWIQP